MNFALILEALKIVAATADAAARSKQVYEALRLSAQQAHALTAEQAAQLDAEAERVFSSPASQPSGR